MRTIAVIGLGYVGLPVAVAFARKFETVGFDVDERRVQQLREGNDATGEVSREELLGGKLEITTAPTALSKADFYVVAVPTPISTTKQPDLDALRAASRTVGRTLSRGDLVVYESTVYPGLTEEVCGPILEAESGLRCGVDFKLGYSPERINPGDREHRFEKIVKVVAGQDAEALEIIAECYGAVVEAGIHRAESIKVAEAAKVIENTQRDLNIALMNELSIIFDRLGIDTNAVLAAAGTKWNFLNFRPGLVGGHCIGVDPFYLTTKAEEVGIHPQVILAGRRINDGMGKFVAEKTVKQLVHAGRFRSGVRIAVLGLSFKENVADVRNSRVPDIVNELRNYGAEVLVHDPLVDPDEARRVYGLELVPREALQRLDGVVYAVPHRCFGELPLQLVKGETGARVLMDVKAVLSREQLPDGVGYWRL